jgi:hypothetical protein
MPRVSHLPQIHDFTAFRMMMLPLFHIANRWLHLLELLQHLLILLIYPIHLVFSQDAIQRAFSIEVAFCVLRFYKLIQLTVSFISVINMF